MANKIEQELSKDEEIKINQNIVNDRMIQKEDWNNQLIFEDEKVIINNKYIEKAANELAINISENIDNLCLKEIGIESLIKLRDSINIELNKRK